MPQDPHDWRTVGEDTGGFVEWCARCGAVKDSGGHISKPEWTDEDADCEVHA